MSDRRTAGCVVTFASARDLLGAIARLRRDGVQGLQAFAPVPLPALDRALDLPVDRVPLGVLLGGLIGGLGTLALQWYSAVIAYPVRVGGRPYASWPAFLPAALEMALLCAVIGGVLVLLRGSQLPRLHHPVFDADAFARVSADRYALFVPRETPGYAIDAIGARLADLADGAPEEVEQ